MLFKLIKKSSIIRIFVIGFFCSAAGLKLMLKNALALNQFYYLLIVTHFFILEIQKIQLASKAFNKLKNILSR